MLGMTKKGIEKQGENAVLPLYVDNLNTACHSGPPLHQDAVGIGKAPR